MKKARRFSPRKLLIKQRDDVDSDSQNPKSGRARIQSDFEMGFSLPKNFYKVVDEIVVCERVFWGRCMLDKQGRRTRTPRPMPNNEFNTFDKSLHPARKHPRG